MGQGVLNCENGVSLKVDIEENIWYVPHFTSRIPNPYQGKLGKYIFSRVPFELRFSEQTVISRK